MLNRWPVNDQQIDRKRTENGQKTDRKRLESTQNQEIGNKNADRR